MTTSNGGRHQGVAHVLGGVDEAIAILASFGLIFGREAGRRRTRGSIRNAGRGIVPAFNSDVSGKRWILDGW